MAAPAQPSRPRDALSGSVRGGEGIAPRGVERALSEHPVVLGAAVVGTTREHLIRQEKTTTRPGGQPA